jgi:DNA polymerase I-like protein with 3'-5' exonuclease and polymerase domains
MLTVNNPNRFDWANMPLLECCEGNALDSYFTLKLFNLFEERLDELKLLEFYNEVLVPAASTFSEMELSGLEVCPKKLNLVGKIIRNFNLETEDTLYSFSEVNAKDNLASTLHLQEILYTREDGFALYPPDKTAKGSPSVSAPTIKILLEQIEEVLDSRD